MFAMPSNQLSTNVPTQIFFHIITPEHQLRVFQTNTQPHPLAPLLCSQGLLPHSILTYLPPPSHSPPLPPPPHTYLLRSQCLLMSISPAGQACTHGLEMLLCAQHRLLSRLSARLELFVCPQAIGYFRLLALKEGTVFFQAFLKGYVVLLLCCQNVLGVLQSGFSNSMCLK